MLSVSGPHRRASDRSGGAGLSLAQPSPGPRTGLDGQDRREGVVLAAISVLAALCPPLPGAPPAAPEGAQPDLCSPSVAALSSSGCQVHLKLLSTFHGPFLHCSSEFQTRGQDFLWENKKHTHSARREHPLWEGSRPRRLGLEPRSPVSGQGLSRSGFDGDASRSMVYRVRPDSLSLGITNNSLTFGED